MIRILLSFFILLTPLTTWADFENDLSAAHNSENIQALRALRARAAAGDADAQFNLGGVFFKGQEVDPDYSEAAKWLRLAAEQGHPQAQYNLGMMYDSGQGVALDHAAAAQWYRLSADRGFALAQLNLGVAYANGEGVAQNPSEAVKWFRLAADQGDAQALFDLGVMYANGQGTKQDLVEAYRCAQLSADQGHEMAKALISDLSKKMTREQRSRANKLAMQIGKNQEKATRKPTVAAQDGKTRQSEPVKTPVTSPAEGNYYVQLGAFKSEQQSTGFLQKMRDKLGEMDRPYSLHTNEGWVRVHIGPYQNRDDAQQTADGMKRKLGFAPKVRTH